MHREPDGGKYIVNGDTPIVDRKHLQEFFENSVQKPVRIERGLIVNVSGGVDTAWTDSDKRNLTYCVSMAFGARHNQVVSAMTAAGDAWEAVADIDFIHADAQDNSCTATNNQVVFDVRPVSGASYLARAFFPNDARSNRNVLINNSAFTLDPIGKLKLEGILRHELGHTLGFRHEHTRPEAGPVSKTQIGASSPAMMRSQPCITPSATVPGTGRSISRRRTRTVRHVSTAQLPDSRSTLISARHHRPHSHHAIAAKPSPSLVQSRAASRMSTAHSPLQWGVNSTEL